MSVRTCKQGSRDKRKQGNKRSHHVNFTPISSNSYIMWHERRKKTTTKFKCRVRVPNQTVSIDDFYPTLQFYLTNQLSSFRLPSVKKTPKGIRRYQLPYITYRRQNNQILQIGSFSKLYHIMRCKIMQIECRDNAFKRND